MADTLLTDHAASGPFDSSGIRWTVSTASPGATPVIITFVDPAPSGNTLVRIVSLFFGTNKGVRGADECLTGEQLANGR